MSLILLNLLKPLYLYIRLLFCVSLSCGSNVLLQIFHLARLLGLNKGPETHLREEGVVSSRISDGHGHTVILVALTALEVS